MGIKIKYDPVGSLFLASYATGEAMGRERRRREWEIMRQREMERLQQSREREADRQFQLQRDFLRENVNLGPIGPVGEGGPAGPLGVAAQAAGGMAAGIAGGGMLGAPNALIAGGQAGDMYVNRDQWMLEQRNRIAGEDDWIRQVEREVNMGVPPEIQANPQVGKRYGVLLEDLRKALSGPVVDRDLPEHRETIQKIRDEMGKIRADNQRDEVAIANQDVMYWDTQDKKFHPDPGDPALGRQPYSKTTRMPIETPAEAEEKKAAKDTEKQQLAAQQKAIDAQRKLEEADLIERNKQIRQNDELSQEDKDKKVKENIDAHNAKWFPAEQPAAPPAGQPGAADGQVVWKDAQGGVFNEQGDPVLGRKPYRRGTGEAIPMPGAAAAPPAQGKVSIVRTKEEFDALPSGQIFMDPDGKFRRKP